MDDENDTNELDHILQILLDGMKRRGLSMEEQSYIFSGAMVHIFTHSPYTMQDWQQYLFLLYDKWKEIKSPSKNE